MTKHPSTAEIRKKLLRDHQQAVFDQLESLKSSSLSTVSVPNNFTTDPRLCLTIVYFLEAQLRQALFTNLITPLQAADLAQHYYRPESLHLTIQNVRTIANPPTFSAQDIEVVKGLLSKLHSPPLEFELKGLVTLPASLAVRCYPTKETTEVILALRKSLAAHGVADNKRYISDTIVGNITICRYYSKPNQQFFQIVEQNKNNAFGNITIDTLSLITTNAVCDKEKTSILQTHSVTI